MKYAFITLLVAFASLGGYLFVYLGAYKSAEVHGLKTRDFHLLYKDHFGPYHHIAKVIADVETWASKKRIPCRQTFGLFLDDPEKVDPERLKSLAGCVLETPDPVPLGEGFKIQHLPEAPYLHLSFSGSPAIGPSKVYSKVDQWLNEHRYRLVGPVLEMYTLKNNNQLNTDYFFPVGH